MSNPIYHYTSADGLLGALRSRRIWASQATSLNDHAEIRQGWELIIEVLRDLLVAHPDDGDLQAMLSWAASPVDQVRHVCVLSASLRGDDAAQWRLYGGASRGYVIELDPAEPLAAVADAVAPPAPTHTPGHLTVDFDVFFVSDWLAVIYDSATLRQAVHDLWRAYAAAIPPPPDPALSRSEQEAAYAEWAGNLDAVSRSELATLAHLVKSAGFAGEQEVRLVVSNLLGSNHLRYRSGPHGIVGYHEMATPPAGHSAHRPLFVGGRSTPLSQLPVQSIRVGPLAPDGHEDTVRDLLEGVDLGGVVVARSEVPLR